MTSTLKYQRKPVYCFTQDIPKSKEVRELRTCISGISKSCTKTFLTTKEHRICPHCAVKIKEGNLY